MKEGIDMMFPSVPNDVAAAQQPLQADMFSSDRRTERRLTELLWALGIPMHMKGYHYLRKAVEHALETSLSHPSLTSQLYPFVAGIYQTSAACVERNIRSAIEAAWQRGNLAAASDLFGRSFNLAYDKPSNGEMIALLMERLRMDLYL